MTQRPIKFRMWDVDLKKFILVGCVQQDCHKDGTLELSSEGRIIYLQFTGLKDKNGKEIYEGDIVDVKSGFVESRYTFQVVWDEDGCSFRLTDPRYMNDTESVLNYDDWKIIGNIYENPELLKSTQMSEEEDPNILYGNK